MASTEFQQGKQALPSYRTFMRTSLVEVDASTLPNESCGMCYEPYISDDPEQSQNIDGFQALPFDCDVSLCANPPVRLPCPGHHIFCRACITGWLSSFNSCPYCRLALHEQHQSGKTAHDATTIDIDSSATPDVDGAEFDRLLQLPFRTFLKDSWDDDQDVEIDAGAMSGDLADFLVILAKRFEHPRPSTAFGGIDSSVDKPAPRRLLTREKFATWVREAVATDNNLSPDDSQPQYARLLLSEQVESMFCNMVNQLLLLDGARYTAVSVEDRLYDVAIGGWSGDELETTWGLVQEFVLFLVHAFVSFHCRMTDVRDDMRRRIFGAED